MKYDKKVLKHLDVCHMEQKVYSCWEVPSYHQGSGPFHFSFHHHRCVDFWPYACCLMAASLLLQLHMWHLMSGRKKKEGKQQNPISETTSMYVSWPEMYHRASLDPWECGRASGVSLTYCYRHKIEFSSLRRKRECLLGRQLAKPATLVQIFICSPLRN